MRRQHPIAILRLITKNFWLLIIPLIRGLIALRFDFYDWVQGAYLDIIVIVVILFSAILRWFFIKYEVGEKNFIYKSGVIVKSSFEIPYTALSAVTTERTFWIRPFHAVKIFLDTDGHSLGVSPKSADIFVTTNLEDCEKLFQLIQTETTKANLTDRKSVV